MRACMSFAAGSLLLTRLSAHGSFRVMISSAEELSAVLQVWPVCNFFLCTFRLSRTLILSTPLTFTPPDTIENPVRSSKNIPDCWNSWRGRPRPLPAGPRHLRLDRDPLAAVRPATLGVLWTLEGLTPGVILGANGSENQAREFFSWLDVTDVLHLRVACFPSLPPEATLM